MMHSFRAGTTFRAGQTPIRASGPLHDGPRARVLLDAIRLRAERGARDITVDLSAVPFLDGGAIGLLLRGRLAALRSGSTFRVVGAPERVRRALKLVGLLDLLEKGTPDPPRVREAPGQDVPLLLSA